MVLFDVDKFCKHLEIDIEFDFISTNDYIKIKYGEEFYNFFKEELTSKPMNALALIL